MAPRKRQRPDVIVSLGSIANIWPRTAKGERRVQSNVSYEPWQRTPSGIACEHRYAEGIAAAARADGLKVVCGTPGMCFGRPVIFPDA